MPAALDWTALSPALPAPAAVVDLDAFTHNAERIAAAAGGKRLRLVVPHLPCPALLQRLLTGGNPFAGLLVGSPAEAAFYAGLGFDDLLLITPPGRPREAALAVELLRKGTHLWSVVDELAQAVLLAEAGAEAGLRVPLLLEVDVSWRPSEEVAGAPRRSALIDSEAALALGRELQAVSGVRIAGYLAYEAQLAREVGASLAASAVRAIVRRQAARLAPDRRGALLDGLRELGVSVLIGTGGGSAALPGAGGDPACNELCVGSALLTPSPEAQRELDLRPALFLHTVVARKPEADLIVVGGGGLVEGAPILPASASRLSTPGWGARLTPLRVTGEAAPPLGAPVIWRPEAPGLLDRVGALWLARGHGLAGSVETAAGLGFLGE
jgi:D-serine deaminase-like pyridoxal phosphate-dependent protein